MKGKSNILVTLAGITFMFIIFHLCFCIAVGPE